MNEPSGGALVYERTILKLLLPVLLPIANLLNQRVTDSLIQFSNFFD